jgi:uncharacterized phiE125 gp8 family phage protein
MINFRSLKRVAGPFVEPVTLTEAKQHLRVDTETDDAYIVALISAAREYCEDYLDRTLTSTQWQMRLDNFPAEIGVPRPPMIASGTATAVSVTYVENSAGGTTTLSLAEYRIDRDATPGALRPLYGGSWPSHLSDENSLVVTWWGGYGDSAESVPRVIRHAILMLVATWYERRQAVDSTSASEVPMGAKALLDSARWGAYR